MFENLWANLKVLQHFKLAWFSVSGLSFLLTLTSDAKTLLVYLGLSVRDHLNTPGPEVIKLFSCSTQLSMKFFLLINVKMPTIVGILTFMSRTNSILDLSEPKNLNFLTFSYL